MQNGEHRKSKLSPNIISSVGYLMTIWVPRPQSVDDKLMNMEQSVECELAGETEVLGKKKTCPDNTFCNMTWRGIETEPPRREDDE
jgi:hypothetical protein